ncbi:MAG TPA: hypothetical protein VEQ11_06375 [Chloroflexota bacterium]|nr:hypothetical protein [Chloroflexota bacterium]
MCSSPPRPAPILTALARGEYAVFLSASHADVIAQRKAGAPIKLLRPSEGVGITQINQSLIKNAPHRQAVDQWSLSEEGQNLLAQQGYATVRQAPSRLSQRRSWTVFSFSHATTTRQWRATWASAASAGSSSSSRIPDGGQTLWPF